MLCTPIKQDDGSWKCADCGFTFHKHFYKNCQSKKTEAEEGIVDKPNLLDKAAKLGGAIYNHVAGGMTTASKELADKRLEICNQCEFRAGVDCGKCGCMLDAKIWFNEEECPVGKW